MSSKKGRMIGYVQKHFASKKYLLIKGQDGELYFALHNDSNFTKGHWCLFQPPTEVSFDKGAVQSGGRPLAQNVRLVEQFEFLEKEMSQVYLWKGTHGFAHRDCGCSIFIDASAIITLGEVEVGTTLYHSVVPSTKPDGVVSWKASQIEVCISDPPPHTGLAEYMIYPQQ
jgi:hypothetical protein